MGVVVEALGKAGVQDAEFYGKVSSMVRLARSALWHTAVLHACMPGVVPGVALLPSTCQVRQGLQ